MESIVRGKCRSINILLCASVLLAGVPHGAQAQAADVEANGARRTDAALEEVTVTGSRLRDESVASTGTKTGTPLIETPMAISVVGEQQIETMALANVADVLRYIAGAQDNTNVWEHSDGYNVRGFDQSAYILLDGQLRNDPGWWAASEPFALERIEVIKGPASVLYGQSPPGGMVSMTTKRPSVNARNQIEVSAGSFDERAVGVDVNGAIGDGRVLGRLVGMWMEEGDQIRSVKFGRYLIQPTVTWRVSDKTEITLLAWYQVDRDDYNSDVPAIGSLKPGVAGRLDYRNYYGDPQFKDSYRTEQRSIGYELNHRFNEAWSFKQNFRHFLVDVTGKDVVYAQGLQEDGRTLNRAIADFTERVKNWQMDSSLLGKFSTGHVEHTLLAGVDAGRYDWYYDGDYGEVSPIDLFEPTYGNVTVGTREPWVYRSQPRQLGVYVQEQAKISGHLVVLAGGRYDRARNTDFDGSTYVHTRDGKLSGRIGLLYLFEEGFAPYVSYATSFLPLAGTDIEGRAFVPETGRQAEVGLKYEAPSGALQATVAAFEIVRANMLTRDPIYPAFQVQNGEQRHRGVEVEATWRPGAGVRVDISGSLLDAEVTRSFDPGIEGNRPNDVSRTSASLRVEYPLPIAAVRGLAVDLGVNYRGKSFGDPENTLRQPDYTLLDAGVRYAAGPWRIALTGTNLANERYVSSCWSTDYCARNEPRLWSVTSAYRW